MQCAALLASTDRMFAGLDDSHRALEPQPGAKTAGWLIGHLAVTGDFARRMCGRPPICPREWRAMFNPGTTPSTDASTYPPMAELCNGFRAVYRDLSDAALAAEPALFAGATPYEPARGDFPTTGDFVAYLASGHLAYHLGQLVGWRAAAGLGRLQPDSIA